MKKLVSYISIVLALGLTVGCTSGSAQSKGNEPKGDKVSEMIGDSALTLSDVEMKGTIKIST